MNFVKSVLLLFAHGVRNFFPREASEYHDHASNLPSADAVLIDYDGAQHSEEFACGCYGDQSERAETVHGEKNEDLT